MNILVTGSCGFIGFHLTMHLCSTKKNKIFGIDNLNSYYDIKLKKDRLKILKEKKNFSFVKLDISNFSSVKNFFKKKKINTVIHLAAQAGVRHSITNPEDYVNSNLIGFYNIIENSRIFKVKKFLYASTSSVYGDSKKFPLNETKKTDEPKSFYAATKKSNELLAHSYFEIHGFKSIGMRFFTVYGPYGRPDMALYKFTKSILENKEIDLYNQGNHIRDFTYISDVIESVSKLAKKNFKTAEIINISGSDPQPLKKFLKLIEKYLKVKAKIKYEEMQLGDVYKTHGDNSKLKKYINFSPKVSIEEGILNFVNWYKIYFKVNE